ncbi:energy transducer TonB [Dolichospermum lemmermannii CS-548]|uniref:energy transducer TonB n=1 Tax=Dolichospermum lemmermannii TaxID=54295 RepID=UPI00232D6506|nr:energy transducer TonB [Dolichospermum lemmermannii]MDB9439383.1 energy transducer TonB [Dolichospermum lemmermannii CS-548]
MEFSSVTIEQREKEAEALKTFLFFSLIGSLVLHIGILALAINKFFLKFPEVREEPIEVTILETIPQEVNQLPVEIKSLAKTNSGGGGGNKGGGISTPTETALNMIKSSVAPITKQAQLKITTNLISKQSQTLTNREPAKILTPVQTNPIENTTPEPATTPPPVETKPIQKLLDENANTLASTQPQVQTKPTKITPLKSETQPNASSNNIPSNSTASTQLPQNKNILGNLGDRSRNSLGTGNGTGSGTGVGNGIGNSTGNGTGNGVGNESGNKPKSENTPIATAPKPPIENNSKLNRADCIQCQIKYPDRARQRGIEGNAEVAIDTDSQGNVTRVRLVRSSGDSELDQAAQQAAQEWKLTPTAEGREGVRASVNFAIKGSQRHRKLQERQIQKQRATTKKTSEKATSTSTPIESPQYNQQKITPIITDIPSENTTKQREESAPSESQQISPPASATTSPTES